jgi:hypothetical protein
VFDWLFERHAAVFALLAAAGAVLLVMWWRTRKRRLLYGVAAVAAVALVYFLLGFVKETDAKQIERKIHEMEAGVNEKNLDKTFQHISDQLRISARGKSDLRAGADSALRRFDISDMQLFDIDIEEISRPDKRANVTFNAKAKGNWGGGAFYRVRSEWVLEADGQWRMRGFTLHNPVNNDQLSVPF